MYLTSFLQPGDYLEFLASSAIKTSLVLVVALALCALLKKRSASFRYFLLNIALLGIVILPLSTYLLPRWEVLSAPMFVDADPTRPAIMRDAGTAPQSIHSFTTGSTPISNSLRSEPDGSSVPSLIAVIYAIGVGAMLLGLAASLFRVRKLRRSSTPIPYSRQQVKRLADDAARQAGIAHDVEVLFTNRVSVPITCGWRDPAVLLPIQAVEWSDDRLTSVFLHEMAHIKRKDNVTSVMAHLVAVWQWFNPLVWLVLKRLCIEREKACDDHVLNTGISDITYAHHLVEIGRSLAIAGRLAPAGLALVRKTTIKGRIMNILDTSKNRETVTTRKALIIALLTLLVIVPLAGLTGKAQDVKSTEVTAVQKQAILTTLKEFYDALSSGEDFDLVRDRFLTKDYFARTELTMENLDRNVWKSTIDNMLSCLAAAKCCPRQVARAGITSISREDGQYILTLRLNITQTDGDVRKNVIVKDLEHRIVMVEEDGAWKISEYNDGISVMRMDVNNPYGPIFLIWIKNRDKSTTPCGEWVFKIFPAELGRDNKSNLQFVLEEE